MIIDLEVGENTSIRSKQRCTYIFSPFFFSPRSLSLYIISLSSVNRNIGMPCTSSVKHVSIQVNKQSMCNLIKDSVLSRLADGRDNEANYSQTRRASSFHRTSLATSHVQVALLIAKIEQTGTNGYQNQCLIVG